METLEKLKSIIDNAPVDERATHYSNSELVYYAFKCECWMWCPEKSNVFHFLEGNDDVVDDLRSLSDIKRIVELMEWQLGIEKKYKYLLETSLNDQSKAYR